MTMPAERQDDFAHEDRFLPCRDCGILFLFTRLEQANYAQQGYTQEPSRCPACRLIQRKLRRDRHRNRRRP